MQNGQSTGISNDKPYPVLAPCSGEGFDVYENVGTATQVFDATYADTNPNTSQTAIGSSARTPIGGKFTFWASAGRFAPGQVIGFIQNVTGVGPTTYAVVPRRLT